jgi:hypothetical protein
VRPGWWLHCRQPGAEPSHPHANIGKDHNDLVDQKTRDPSTSWLNGYGLRRALGRRAVMVTVNAGGHIALGRGACADTAAAAFLTTGVLPSRDQFCQGPAPADPTVRRWTGAAGASVLVV